MIAPIVDTEWLVANAGHEDLVVADVRWYLDGRSGWAAYESGHLPGARFVDMDTALSDHHRPATEGRHPFPTPEHFAEAMGELGIGDGTTVVAYDDSGGGTAGRLVVMLRMLGRAAALLDGGLKAWDGPVETGSGSPIRPARFTAAPWPAERLATADDVAAPTSTGPDGGPPRTVVLDAHAGARFRGETEPVDPRAGHIPGALNAPFAANMDAATGRFRSPEELAEHYRQFGVDADTDVVCYCGSGVAACADVLAIERAGGRPPRLFVASWSGWSSDPDRPAAVGPAVSPDTVEEDAEALTALRALRTTRLRKRTEAMEWFEVAYKVYVAGFLAIGAVVLLSHLAGDGVITDAQRATVRADTPGLVGLAAALVIALGLRSGSRGGPLSVEEPDVLYVLLAPLDRRKVLARPAAQQVRRAAFAGAAAGGVGGQLLGRRLGEPLVPWAIAGAAAGVTIGLTAVAAGLLAHTGRLRRWHATTLGAAILVWQGSAVASDGDVPGPLDTMGSLVLWPMRVHPIDLAAPAVAIVATMVGFATLRRCSVDALARRSALVSQLRFAVTVRDLRTVVLLRRQLSNEQHRVRPWFRVPSGERWPVAVRGARSLARFPLSRLVRMAVLTAIAAVAQVAAYRGATPAVAVSGLAAFVLGLECIEPFAQELDQSDRGDAVPHVRGWLLVRHLPVPALAASVFGLLGAVGAALGSGGTADGWALAIVLALPVVLAGLAGAVLNTLAGIPDPITPGSADDLLPPEVAGLREMWRTLRPLIVAALGSLPVLASRQAARHGDEPLPPAVQCAVAVGLVLAAVAWWTRQRDQVRGRLRSLWKAGDVEFNARRNAAAERRGLR